MSRIMTVDVEDYFQVSAFEHVLDRSQWQHYPHRVEANTDRILSLFESRGIQATFFVLGWIAEHYPDLVKRIRTAGHEIASHGYAHQRVRDVSRKAFRQDVERSKKLLEDLSGEAVLGYRAPSFSIGPNESWAHEELLGAGYRYSSSVYPVNHDHYGWPDAPRIPFVTESGLLEVPLSTLRLRGRNYPIAGGGFFRLYPLWFSSWAMRAYESEGIAPYIFYIHPWELDPEQPRVKGLGIRQRFRHYLNLSRVESRLNRLTSTGQWNCIRELVVNQRTQQDRDVMSNAQISTG